MYTPKTMYAGENKEWMKSFIKLQILLDHSKTLCV